MLQDLRNSAALLEGSQTATVCSSDTGTIYMLSMEHWLNYTERVKKTTRGNTFTNATLSNKNPMWTGLRSWHGLRGDRPMTNRLSHGTAMENGI